MARRHQPLDQILRPRSGVGACPFVRRTGSALATPEAEAWSPSFRPFGLSYSRSRQRRHCSRRPGLQVKSGGDRVKARCPSHELLALPSCCWRRSLSWSPVPQRRGSLSSDPNSPAVEVQRESGPPALGHHRCAAGSNSPSGRSPATISAYKVHLASRWLGALGDAHLFCQLPSGIYSAVTDSPVEGDWRPLHAGLVALDLPWVVSARTRRDGHN